jgi:hypothetical protein
MPEIDSRRADHEQGSGPVGRALRVALGVLLLASIATFYVSGSGQFVLASAAVGVGLIIVYIGLRAVVGRRAGVGPWLGSVIALVPLVSVYVLGAGGGVIFGAGEGQLGALTFLGVSLILAGLRADSGCEVMALPNALSGKRSDLACLVFSPVDRLERRWRRGSRAP